MFTRPLRRMRVEDRLIRTRRSVRRSVDMRRTTAFGLLVTMIAALFALGMPALPAAAEPGVPADPILLFEEDFENRSTGSNMLLTDYTGASGMTYSGSPYWVDRPSCNGFIIDQTSAKDPDDCLNDGLPDDSFNTGTSLTYALGVNAGAADPALNAGAMSYTAGSGTDNEVMFSTDSMLTLPAANRFVTFSVDAAAVNCFATHPQMRFYLVDGDGNEIPVSDTAINPCTDDRAQTMSVPTQNGDMREVAVGSFTADSSLLLQGDQLGIVLRNENGNGIGNDGAYDNIKVLDVTPQLDKSFSPETEFVDGVSTLTLTVTNTSELAAKAGWSFTDNLPDGLVVADSPNVGGSCAATVQADAGSSAITVEDGQLATGEVSCTITVDVTSSTAGVYENGPDNYADLVGLNPPTPATVEFVESVPELTLEKTSDADNAAVGDTVNYTFVATNTGDATVSNAMISETSFDGAGDMSALDCAPAQPATLAPGEALTCTATYVVQQADVDAGGITNVAAATGEDPDGDPVPPAEDEARIPFEQTPALELAKTADATELVAGETVTYTFIATNSGNVTVSNATVSETSFDGAGDMSALDCAPAQPATLAPEETMTCTATYVVQQADVDAGGITNVAAATGDDPDGEPVPPAEDEVAIPSDPQPELTLDKTADKTEAVAGETITYTFVATNTGNTALEDVAISEGDFSGAGDLSALECDIAAPVTLVPGEALTCTATYVVQQADVDAGGIANSATADGTPPPGAPDLVPPTADHEVPAYRTAALDIEKTADTDEAEAGDTITYTYTVENNGNVTVSDVEIEETEFSGAGELSELECDAAVPTTLAPGETLVCTATYEVQKADVEAGEITNAALATGKDPSGGGVESPIGEASVLIGPLVVPVDDKSLPRTGVAMLPVVAASIVGCVGGLALMLISRRLREKEAIEQA